MHESLTADKIAQWDTDSNQHVAPVVNDLLPFLSEYGLTTVKVLDIGSNIGKFIELLSEHCEISDAILVEPIFELQQYAKTRHPKYHFESVLVSDTTELLPIYTPVNTNLGLSRILSHPDGISPDELRYVKAESAATILMRYPGFVPDIIKVDAEGYDVKIVTALAGHLYRTGMRPIVIFECVGGVNLDALLAAYTKIGYRAWSRLPDCHSRDVFLLP